VERQLGEGGQDSLFREGRAPRAYLVGRIRKQAADEGFEFTEFEKTYLSVTERGDDDSAVKMLDRIKGRKFEQFSQRINSLAWRAYSHDLAVTPEAKQQYDKALRLLASSDEWPNRSMFINSLFREESPEQSQRKDRWFRLAWYGLILAGILFFLVRALYDH